MTVLRFQRGAAGPVPGAGGDAPTPLIAVTTSELRPPHQLTATPQGEPLEHEMALGLKYLEALERAGSLAMVIPPLREQRLATLLDRLSGVCLSGGPDLDPLAYGSRRHAQLGPTWARLDRFELAVARAALQRGLPILAICRGLHVLNVARGGTLHQHLPDVLGERIVHRQAQPGSEPTHWVTFTGHSRLRDVLGGTRAKVNSFHHQAVAQLGSGLIATSRAADGTIESLEAVDQPFMIGVQWHAECLVGRPRQLALFKAFVRAAQDFEAAACRDRHRAAGGASDGAPPVAELPSPQRP